MATGKQVYIPSNGGNEYFTKNEIIALIHIFDFMATNNTDAKLLGKLYQEFKTIKRRYVQQKIKDETLDEIFALLTRDMDKRVRILMLKQSKK